MVWRSEMPPSCATGACRTAPTDRIAACGGLMIAVKLLTANMPRLETVNVPPDSSGGVIEPSRTRAASARASRAISPSAFRSASNTVGTTSVPPCSPSPSVATATPTLTRPCTARRPSR